MTPIRQINIFFFSRIFIYSFYRFESVNPAIGIVVWEKLYGHMLFLHVP